MTTWILRVRKTQYYGHGTRLAEARWHSDDGGFMDTLIVNESFEEELSRSPISGTQ